MTQVVHVAVRPRVSSLGVASLILGLAAFLFCWIPILGLLSIPLGGLGILLALIGLMVSIARGFAGIGWPIAGGVVAGVALAVTMGMHAAIGHGLERAAEEANGTNQITSQSSKEAATDQWAPADQPVTQGDLQVKVVGVDVGRVALRTMFGDPSTSEKSLLSITIQITNLSATKKGEYRTWRDDEFVGGASSRLVDNFENSYRRIDFGTSTIVGGVTQESIYPEKSISDVLVFQAPVGKFSHLHLELAAERFGGKGKLRIEIPASMIRST